MAVPVTIAVDRVEASLNTVGAIARADVERLLAVATRLVTRFAPDAPDEVLNEAVVRCVGWLAETPPSGVRQMSTGEVTLDYTPGQKGALRHSGGMSLLSPWKVRNAGLIGGD